MTDHHTEIVKRVMCSLEETTDPEELVAAYFDVDQDVVVQATKQNLEATGESVSAAVIAERVETELVEALRLPKGGAGGGLLPTLYVHRGWGRVGPGRGWGTLHDLSALTGCSLKPDHSTGL